MSRPPTSRPPVRPRPDPSARESAEPTCRPPAPTAPVAVRPTVERAAPGSVSASRAAQLAGRVGAASRIPRFTDAVARTDGAPRWVSGLLAGVQAALLSLLVVAVPALAAYVATSADPSNAEIGWPRAVAVGAALWLLGHGAVLDVGGWSVTMVPLGITALALFVAYASARRSAHRTRSAWLAGVGGYGAVVLAVVLLSGSTGPLGSGAWALLRTLVGTAAVAALGIGAGVVRPRRLREATARWWTRVPPAVRSGTVGGTIVVALLVGTAALVTCAWVLAGRAATGDVVAGLGVDLFGGALLALAQLAVAPNLVLWAMAWLAGPGFAVGAGTVYSPSEIVSAPLPALPLLGALPPPGSEGGALPWAPVLLVAGGALGGAWLRRRLVAERAWDSLAGSAALAVTAGVLAATLCVLAGGAVGPGRLAVVGASGLLVGLTVAAGGFLGAALVAVPSDPLVREVVGGWSGRLRARLGRAVGTGRAAAGTLGRRGAREPHEPSVGASSVEPDLRDPV